MTSDGGVTPSCDKVRAAGSRPRARHPRRLGMIASMTDARMPSWRGDVPLVARSGVGGQRRALRLPLVEEWGPRGGRAGPRRLRLGAVEEPARPTDAGLGGRPPSIRP